MLLQSVFFGIISLIYLYKCIIDSFYSVKIQSVQLSRNRLNIGISGSLWKFVRHMIPTSLLRVFDTA